MPRDGAGTYTLAPGSAATDGEVLTASKWNTTLNDIESDANAARPVGAGGTGATAAADARANLGIVIGDSYVRANGIASGTVIPASTPTKIQFLEQVDASGLYANGTYTVPATGLYDVRHNTMIPAQATGFSSLVDVYSNGVAKERGGQIGGNTFAGTRQMPAAHLFNLVAGDTIEIYVTHTFSSSVTIAGTDNDGNNWFLRVMRVR